MSHRCLPQATISLPLVAVSSLPSRQPPVLLAIRLGLGGPVGTIWGCREPLGTIRDGQGLWITSKPDSQGSYLLGHHQPPWQRAKSWGKGGTWAIQCSSPEGTRHPHSQYVGRIRQGLAAPSLQYLKGARSGNTWQETNANDYDGGPKRWEDLWGTHGGRCIIVSPFGSIQDRGHKPYGVG